MTPDKMQLQNMIKK